VIFAGCTRCALQSDDDLTITDAQVRNLEKLCKVWGFTKYTHQSFISGQLNWDAELLYLLPIVFCADKDEVNDILYDWFVGLGDDGFDMEVGHDFDLATIFNRTGRHFNGV